MDKEKMDKKEAIGEVYTISPLSYLNKPKKPY
jgi:hypothetical protein